MIFLCLHYFCLSPQKLYLWNTKNIKDLAYKSELADLRKNIVKQADKYLKTPAIAITDREKIFAPDKHYYESIGPYWWPDPNVPNGTYIRKDGEKNPESNNYDNVRMVEMKNRVMYFSFAFYLTHENKYYEGAQKQLNVWFINPETRMLPNLEYGQILPGINNNHGRDAGLIDMYSIINPLLESVRFLHGIKKLDRTVYEGLQLWCKEFLYWCETSDIGQKEGAANNNHSIALDVTMLNLALFVNDKECAKRINDTFLSERLMKQIDKNGMMPAESKRTKSYSYHIYNLTHIIDYCIIRQNMGNNYYRKNQKIIDRSISYLLGYIGNKEKWLFEEISDWNALEKDLGLQVQRLKRLKHKKQKFNASDYKYDNTLKINNILQ